MSLRSVGCWTLAGFVLAWAVIDTVSVGPVVTIPAVLAVIAALLALGPGPGWLGGGFTAGLRPGAWPVAVGGVAVVSLAATTAYRGEAENQAAMWWLVETAALLALLLLITRREPAGRAVTCGALILAAVSVSPLRLGLRLDPPSPAEELVILCMAWSLVGLAAVATGAYLRWLELRRVRSIAAARHAQRIGLARDLHDFVAHEVSGIVVQAQAAQVVGEHAPDQARDTLTRIEHAGLRALSSLDRTVHMLHAEGTETTGDTRVPDLAGVAELVERFRATHAGRVCFDLAPELTEAQTPPEVAGTAYRIVVEALTNVRRHASASSTVDVTVSRTRGCLTVTVVNGTADRPAAPSLDNGERAEGRGLAGLGERVEALGGTLRAGRFGQDAWRLSAVLPLREGDTPP